MNIGIDKKRPAKKQWNLFFIAALLVMFVILFNYIPLCGWILSLFEYHAGTPLFQNQFVGLKYFSLIFNDRDMLRVFKNTLIFAGINFASLPLPMIFAVLLNEIGGVRFKKLTQTVTTLPHFVSWVIIFSFAFSIFSTNGVLNQYLMKLGLISKPTNILSDADASYWFQFAMGTWKELGWSTIIYTASLAGIDQQLYEAAHIDGAGRFRAAIHITLPGLMPTFIILMLLCVSNFTNVGFDQYFVFKNSITISNLEVLDLYTYRVGLQLNDYSYATAIGILKSAASIAMLFGANVIVRRVRGTSII